jgi:fibronectin type 3 domain-containing protein
MVKKRLPRFYVPGLERLEDRTAPAGITVTPTEGLVTTESGGTATFTIVLQSQPAAPVTIALASSNLAEGAVAPGSVIFTPSNWDQPQTVTVRGVDDGVQSTFIAYNVVTSPALSADPDYQGLDAPDVALSNYDDDLAADQLPALHFDFNSGDSPTAVGYTGVNPNTVYSAAQGYGWMGATPSGFDNPSFNDAADTKLNDLLRDGQTDISSPFQVDLPNGIYRVHVLFAYRGHYAPGFFTTVGGGAQAVSQPSPNRGGPATPLGYIHQESFDAEVTGGNLQLQLTIPNDGQFRLNALDVVPAASGSMQLSGPGAVAGDPLQDAVTINGTTDQPAGSVLTVSVSEGPLVQTADADANLIGTQVVVGSGGAFSFQVLRPAAAITPTLSITDAAGNAAYVAADPSVLQFVLPTEWHFDFNAPTSMSGRPSATPTAPGYLGVVNTHYGPLGGETGSAFGWVGQAPPAFDVPAFKYNPIAGEPDKPLTSLLRDGVRANGQRFQVDLPNGTYRVNVLMGQAGVAHSGLGIAIEGGAQFLSGPPLTGLASAAGNLTHQTYDFQQITFIVQVTGGNLILQFTAPHGGFFPLNALDIAPLRDAGVALFSAGSLHIERLRAGVSPSIITLRGITDLPDGTLLTVQSTLGIINPNRHDDRDFAIAGTQLLVNHGTFQFELRMPTVAGTPAITFTLLNGSAATTIADPTVLSFVLPSEWHLDFNTSGPPASNGYVSSRSPTAQGYYPGVRSLYTLGQTTYGWVNTVPSADFDSPAFSDPASTILTDLLRDGIAVKNKTFEVDLANGTYWVNVTLGDPSAAHAGLGISVGGGAQLRPGPPLTGLASARGQFQQVRFLVRVTAENLQLKLTAPKGDIFPLNALDVAPVKGNTIVLSGPGAIGDDPDGPPAVINGASDLAGGALVTVATSAGRITTADADPALAGIQVAIAADGSFSFQVQPAAGGGTPTLTAGEIMGLAATTVTDPNVLQFVALPSRHFDLGTHDSPVAAGYQQVSDTTVYGSAAGFGWVGVVPAGFDVSDFADTADPGLTPLLRDGQLVQGGTFRVDLPLGRYRLNALLGNALTASSGLAIAITGGAQLVSGPPLTGLSTTVGQFSSVDFVVDVTAGNLQLQFSAPAKASFPLNALDIEPATAGSIALSGPGTVDADPGQPPVTITGVSSLAAGAYVTVATSLGTIASADADPSIAGTQVVVASDGSFSFQITRPTGAGIPTLTAAEVTGAAALSVTDSAVLQFALPTTLHFDFGSRSSPVAPGYRGVNDGSLYAASPGYGWVGRAPDGFDRGSFRDKSNPTLTPLLRDGQIGGHGTFQIDLPNGEYRVTVTMGDATQAHTGRVAIGGGAAFDDPSLALFPPSIATAMGEFRPTSFNVAVTGGNLQVVLSTHAGQTFGLVALDIVPQDAGTIKLSGPGTTQADASQGSVSIYGTTDLPAGTLLTVSTSLGAVAPTVFVYNYLPPYNYGYVPQDVDSAYAGVQVLVDSYHSFHFDVLRPGGAGVPTLTVAAVNGAALTTIANPTVLGYVLPTTRHFDFNAAGSPTAANYLGVEAGRLYGLGQGYGWLGTAPPAFDRSNFSDPADAQLTSLLRDGQSGSGGTFQVDVPDGQYRVTVTMGDKGAAHRGTFTVGGGARFDNLFFAQVPPSLATAAGEFRTSSFDVDVTGGNLQLACSAPAGQIFALTALDIGPETAAFVSLDGPGTAVADPSQGSVTLTGFAHLPPGTLLTVDTSMGSLTPVLGLVKGRTQYQDADPAYAGTQVRVGVDGTFKIVLDRPSTSGVPTITLRAVNGAAIATTSDPNVLDYVLPDRHFDFNAAASPTAAGYIGVAPGSAYHAKRGYGWVDKAPAGFDSSSFTDAANPALTNLLRDGQSASDSAFRVDLPNGLYRVNVTLGSATAAQSCDIHVVAGGRLVSTAPLTVIATTAGQFRTVTFEVEILDGYLQLEFSTPTGVFVLNALDVVPDRTGEISLSGPGTVELDRVTAGDLPGTVTITGSSDLPAGTLVTVASSLGLVESSDADAYLAGTQVEIGAQGYFSFEIMKPANLTPAYPPANGAAVTPTLSAIAVTGAAAATVIDPAVLQFRLPTTWSLEFGASQTGPNIFAAYPFVGPEVSNYGFVTTPPGTVGTDGSFRLALANGTYDLELVLLNPNPPTVFDSGQNQQVPASPINLIVDATNAGPAGVGTGAAQALLQPSVTTFLDIPVTVGSGFMPLVFHSQATDPEHLQIPYYDVLAILVFPGGTFSDITLNGPGTVLANPVHGPVTITGTARTDAFTGFADALEVTVATTLGHVVSPDIDPNVPGIQVPVDSHGAFRFDVERPIYGGVPTLTVTQVGNGVYASFTDPGILAFRAIDTLSFDMDAGANVTSPVSASVTADTTYDDAGGYGWLSSTGLAGFDNGGSDPLLRDGLMAAGPDTFRLRIDPARTYTLVFAFRDDAFAHDKTSITISGQHPLLISTIPARTTMTRTLTGIRVASGLLNITFRDTGGVDPNFIINGVTLTAR